MNNKNSAAMETQTQPISHSPNFTISLLSLSLTIFGSLMAASANFLKDVDNIWGGDRAQILNNGESITVSLDQFSGSGFQSRNQFLYVKIELDIKLIHGESAGTVTAFYISSTGDFHDEIDLEFLGKVDGDPYILHTNIFCDGIGNRETQFFFWFDPTADFHTYTILWSPLHILLYVDGIPIRELKNKKENGSPFPEKRAMKLYGSLWNADSWATRGGAVKTNWNKGPFRATFKNLRVDGCFWGSHGNWNCSSNSGSWLWSVLDDRSRGQMKWAQQNYMFYNYCNDTQRFPQGLPPEC